MHIILSYYAAGYNGTVDANEASMAWIGAVRFGNSPFRWLGTTLAVHEGYKNFASAMESTEGDCLAIRLIKTNQEEFASWLGRACVTKLPYICEEPTFAQNVDQPFDLLQP